MNEPQSTQRARGSASVITPPAECVGCREPVQPGARVCPHCGTAQQASRWAALGRALKWLGGATALVCLVVAVVQLSDLYGRWRERQEVVADLVAAAALQGEAEDYAGAWKLVEEALRQEPGLRAAHRLRTDLAMRWLRRLAPMRGEALPQTLDPLLPALYLGTVERDPVARADALAHLGWANYLRSRNGERARQIEGYYRRALAADPANVFAHAMWGHWLLRSDGPRTDGAEQVAQALEHFESALAAGRARADVRALELRALLNYERDPRALLAGVVAANEVRIEGGALEPETSRSLLRVLRDTTSQRGAGRAELGQRLDSVLPAAELLATYRWTLRGLGQAPNPADLYALGELAERSGYEQRALAFYQQSFEQASNARSLQSRAAAAIERLTDRSPAAP